MRTTEPIANPAATSKTGLLATLRAVLRATGSAAPLTRRPALLFLPALLLVSLALLAALTPAPSSAAEGCSNEARRIEQGSTYLPDCRAYELVSPQNMVPFTGGSGSFSQGAGRAQAAVAGGGISWFSYYPLSESYGGLFNLSVRGETGWATKSVVPPTSTEGAKAGGCTPSMFFSADLSHMILMDGFESHGLEVNTEKGYCAANEPQLVPGEPEGVQNLFLTDSTSGAYQLVNLTPAGVKPGEAGFQNASADFSRVFFEDSAQLTSAAQGGYYEWTAGAVHLVTVLPDGTAVQGSMPDHSAGASQGFGTLWHTVSSDGKRALFVAGGRLYLRENPEQEDSALGPKGECTDPAKACTVQVDASQASGPGGGGSFLAANTEGTIVYFSDDAAAGLTGDTQPGSGQNLYEYETQSGTLTDLTPFAHAGVMGPSGIGEDGSYFYFVAEGAFPGGSAVEGKPNLYVVHDGGSPSLIATLPARGFVGFELGVRVEGWLETHDWNPQASTARVSPNGRYIGFNSVERLTGYDNTPLHPEDCRVEGGLEEGTFGPCGEIFLYDAVTEKLACVSCDPNGAPVGMSKLPAAFDVGGATGRMGDPSYAQRNVDDNGRVFFNTLESLVPSDVNGKVDVYEYAHGAVSLISSGTSAEDSSFYDASANGTDVFFITTQGLLPSDGDVSLNIYDARAGGGFYEPAPPPACVGEGCRQAAPPGTLYSTPASTVFVGPGNPGAPAAAPKAAKLTRRQRLARALKVCGRVKGSHKRVLCRRRAQRKLGGGK